MPTAKSIWPVAVGTGYLILHPLFGPHNLCILMCLSQTYCIISKMDFTHSAKNGVDLHGFIRRFGQLILHDWLGFGNYEKSRQDRAEKRQILQLKSILYKCRF